MLKASYVMDLTSTLFECFSIISLGYLSSSFRIVSSQPRDLNTYLATFVLPCVIFINIARMKFDTINLAFLLVMLLAKFLIFALVCGLALFLRKRKHFGYAGALAILATQSNDFALGYPLMKSLYGPSKPEMLNYLYLQAPIQLLILNPLGLALLEFERAREALRKSHSPKAVAASSDNDDDDDNQKHATGPPMTTRDATNDHYDADGRNCTNVNITISPNRITQRRPSKGNGFGIGARRKILLQSTDNRSSSSKAQLMDDSSSLDSSDTDLVKRSTSHSLANPAYIVDLQARGSLPCVHRPQDALSVSSDGSMENLDYRIVKSIQSSNRDKQQNGLACGDGSGPYDHHKTDINTIADNHHPNHNHHVQYRNRQCDGDNTMAPDRTRLTNAITTATAIEQPVTRGKLLLGFLVALMTNPLLIGSMLGLLMNLTYGPSLPKPLAGVTKTIAASFAAPALFSIGLSMLGKFDALRKKPNELLLSCALVVIKLQLLPNTMRLLAKLILPGHVSTSEIPILEDFSFLYGLLPTAPGACIIAQKYQVLTDVVSLTMLISTIISAPILLATSSVINPNGAKYESGLDEILLWLSITFGIVMLGAFCVWKLKNLLRNRNSPTR